MKVTNFLWDVVHWEKNNFLITIGRTGARLLVTLMIIVKQRDIKCHVPITTVFNHSGIGVVMARHVKLGEHCVIGHNVTIGGRKDGQGLPTIEDYVVVSPHSIIIGKLTVGHHSVIGAGSVVLYDIPPYSVAVGNPAHVIHKITSAIEYDNYRHKRE